MFAMYVHRPSGGVPEASITEIAQVIEVEGVKLVRSEGSGNFRQLYSFMRLFETRDEALLAAAEEIEAIAGQCMAVAIQLRGQAIECKAGVAAKEPVSV